ncbi:MAG: ATP-binding protein [Acidobacteriota bacterium]
MTEGSYGASSLRHDERARASADSVAELRVALSRAETFASAVFHSMPDPHLWLDRNGRVCDLNRAVSRLSGWRFDDLMGRRISSLIARESRPAWVEACRRMQQAGRVENVALRVCRVDGATLDVAAHGVWLQETHAAIDDERAEILVVVRDETARLALQRHLLQADRLAATGRLAAGVAHEINNPLQAILVYMALVDRHLPGDFAEREAWERVSQGVERIRQIVADLLDLHRGSDHERGPVDLHRVLEEALGLARATIDRHGVRVHREFASELPSLHANDKHVYQVALNLILNALEAMPHGGTLTLRTRPAAEHEVELDVADTGAGIPEQHLPHIFDPFLSAGSRRGTGLGLFVTYNLVRGLGGRIGVDSVPGRGSTFRVAWPARGEE